MALPFFRQLSGGTSHGNKLRFEVKMTVEELANIPMVNGYIFVKWKQLAGGSSSGFTERMKIQKHSVAWKHALTFDATLTVDKETAVLQPCLVQFSVRLEVNGGRDFERIGKVVVDLAEYAGSKPTSRKYLLLESRSNSTLEITTSMRQTAGDPTFRVRTKHTSLTRDEPRLTSSTSSTALDSLSNVYRDGFSTSSTGSLSLKSRRYHSLNLSALHQGSGGKSPIALVDEIFEQFGDQEDVTFPVSGKNLSVQRVHTNPVEPVSQKGHSRELSSNSASSATS